MSNSLRQMLPLLSLIVLLASSSLSLCVVAFTFPPNARTKCNNNNLWSSGSTIITETSTQTPSWRSNSRIDECTNTKVTVCHANNNWEEDVTTRRRRRHPCEPLDSNTPIQDRREAIFASIGTVWALSGLPPWIFGDSTLLPMAHAERGMEAKIELPNPIQGASDRANKQCLVESLGNRECLLYEDPANKLYQGIDTNALLVRLEPAIQAFRTIPALVEVKQWSKITGVMTGPMGEMIRTMGQLSADNVAAQKLIPAVKKDLYALQDAVTKKDSTLLLKYHTSATKNINAFVQTF